MTYAQHDAMLQGRNRESRKVANNTYLQRRADGSIAVMLHSTDVVKFFPDGSVKVNTGGWDSNTTRDRINTWSPFRLHAGRINLPYPNAGPGLPFRQGMRLHPTGNANEWFAPDGRQEPGSLIATGNILRPYTDAEKWDIFMARTMSMQPAAPGVHSAKSFTDGSIYSASRQAGNWVLSHTDRDGNCRWLYASARTLKECKQMAHRFDRWNDASLAIENYPYSQNYKVMIP